MSGVEHRRTRNRRSKRDRSRGATFSYPVIDSRLRTVAIERKDKGGAVCIRCIDLKRVVAGHKDPRVRLTLDVTLRLPNGQLDPVQVARVEAITRRVHQGIAEGLQPEGALEQALRTDTLPPAALSVQGATPAPLLLTPILAHPQTVHASAAGAVDTITLGEALERLERPDNSALYPPGSSHRPDAIRAMRTAVQHFGRDRLYSSLTEWDLLDAYPRQLATEWRFAHDPKSLDESVRRELAREVDARQKEKPLAESTQPLIRALRKELQSACSAERRAEVERWIQQLALKKRGSEGKRTRVVKVARPTPLTKDGGGPRWTETCVNTVFRVASWLRKQRLLSPFVLLPPVGWRATLRSDWQKWTGREVAGKYETEGEMYTFDEYSRMLKNRHLADPRLAMLLVFAVGYRAEQVARLRWSNLRFGVGDGNQCQVVVPGSGRKRGEQRLLSALGREVLNVATGKGHLRELEAARARGKIDDYPLFPGGKLRAGVRAFRAGEIPVSMAGRSILSMLREFERLVGIPSIPTRGTRGFRRLIAEVASAYSSDPLVRNVFSGTSEQMRESIYRKRQRRHTLVAAQDAHQEFEQDLLTGHDPTAQAGGDAQHSLRAIRGRPRP